MSQVDSLNEFYVQENMQLLEQLEEILLVGGKLEKEEIEEIFRVMHTIKGSSAMMGYDSLTKLTHSVEDVFDEIRKGLELSDSKWEEVVDVVLVSIDFLKEEILNVQDGLVPEASIDELHERVLGLLNDNNQNNDENKSLETKLIQDCDNNESIQTIGEKCYCIKVFFEDGCGMEGIRAFGVLAVLDELGSIMRTIPEDLNGECDDDIAKNGLTVYMKPIQDKCKIEKSIQETMLLKSYELVEVNDEEEPQNTCDEVNSNDNQSNINNEIEANKDQLNKDVSNESLNKEINNKSLSSEIVNKEVKNEEVKKDFVKKEIKQQNSNSHASNKNSYLTVNIDKVDMLMNLVGEIVTTESMVEKQSQLENFDRDMFEKQSRRLHQLTNELQDVVMSIRMVPISSTFTKMQRVVRDMNKKTGKSVDLV
ncbi:hypothetical protein CHF27_013500, partial [Romboutsia maritimum]